MSKAERKVTSRVITPDFEEKAALLFVELARYLRAAAAAPTSVEVVPSSLICRTMAPELMTVDPATEETPVETDVTTIPEIVEVEVEVFDTVRVLVDGLASEES